MPLNLRGIARRTLLVMANRLAKHGEGYRSHGSSGRSRDDVSPRDYGGRSRDERSRDERDESRSRDDQSYASKYRSHDRDDRSHDVSERSYDRDYRSRDMSKRSHDRGDRSHDTDYRSRDVSGRSHDKDERSYDRDDRMPSERSRQRYDNRERTDHRNSDYYDARRREKRDHYPRSDYRAGYRSGYRSRPGYNSQPNGSLIEEIEKMLKIERHHITDVIRSNDDEPPQVVWCPAYLPPDVQGHIRGGRDLLHHRCRECRQICLHLLGQPGTRRLCLKCSGYKVKQIELWYFHRSCKHCKPS